MAPIDKVDKGFNDIHMILDQQVQIRNNRFMELYFATPVHRLQRVLALQERFEVWKFK